MIVKRNSLKPIYEEPRPGDIKHSLADISKARNLGYKPSYSLEVGLTETMEEISKAL